LSTVAQWSHSNQESTLTIVESGATVLTWRYMNPELDFRRTHDVAFDEIEMHFCDFGYFISCIINDKEWLDRWCRDPSPQGKPTG
jgi:hypothetical protein